VKTEVTTKAVASHASAQEEVEEQQRCQSLQQQQNQQRQQQQQVYESQCGTSELVVGLNESPLPSPGATNYHAIQACPSL
jgi:hypothetical protein